MQFHRIQLWNIVPTLGHSCRHTCRSPCQPDPYHRCNDSPRTRPDASSPTLLAYNGRCRGRHSSYRPRTWSPCTPYTTFWWGSSCNIPTWFNERYPAPSQPRMMWSAMFSKHRCLRSLLSLSETTRSASRILLSRKRFISLPITFKIGELVAEGSLCHTFSLLAKRLKILFYGIMIF